MSFRHSANSFPVTQDDKVLTILNQTSINCFIKFCERERISLVTKVDSLHRTCYEIGIRNNGEDVLSRFINSLSGQLTAIINSIDKVLIT